MSRMLKTAVSVLLAIILSACGISSSNETASVVPSESESIVSVESDVPGEISEKEREDDNDILVAYFSRTGENYDVGIIEKGNTAIVAEIIAAQTGGELFEIKTVNAYPENYEECTEIAQSEKSEKARPELAESIDNLDSYDTIYLGYPIWWGDMPMAVYTFLESNDFAGKTIISFCTHAGSGLSGTVENISTACPGATVKTGLAIAGTTAQNDKAVAEQSVTEWLK